MDHRIEPGQTYRSLGDPYPHTEPRRIKVVGEPITTWGRHGYGKVDIVTLTADGREIRRRAIEVSQLHAGPIGRNGKPLRTGYVLEQPPAPAGEPSPADEARTSWVSGPVAVAEAAECARQHNAGPSVRECAANDRRWPLEKHGE